MTTVQRRDDIRNIAIIAHVDHGKTSLVDAILRQSGQFRESQLQGACILDSNELERERGITILAKNISIPYKGVKINVIDTPGHADFGGEVERVLMMASGAVILVDAAEGPKPQTRFVVKKALEAGLKPIIVINKIDRPDARPHAVLNKVFDLLIDLGADESIIDSPYIFASGRDGYASHDPADRSGTIQPLLDLILEHIPGPEAKPDETFQMMVTTIHWSEYVGRVATGRIVAGTVQKGMKVVLMREDGKLDRAEIIAVETFDKLGRVEAESASSGDIVALVGLPNPEIGDTVCYWENPRALPRIKVDEPTLSMQFTINSSPLAGKDGKYLTTRHIRDRLRRELESNVALRVEEGQGNESFSVSGRGLLHLSILIEQMRREGYELSIGKPQVIRKRIDGEIHEPFELLTIDVPTDDMGAVMEHVCTRRGQLRHMTSDDSGRSSLEFLIPARGLIGLRTRILNATKGQAVMNHRFEAFMQVEGDLPHRANGVLVSQDTGKAVGFALWKLQERSELFVAPGYDIYEGMIVGENSRDNDMVVNPIKEKKLTNMRASGSDDNILLKPPRDMSLETALEYIEDDEYVEVTPKVIRLRKIVLTETDRRKNSRGRKEVMQEV